ncbi:MAG: transketolase family protein [Succinivibrio sp.]|nr:transketolase family protein [Succinivibrio sp.]
MIANREAYGNALVAIEPEHKNLVVLDADLAAATYTKIFRDKFPDKFIECGIAESNMMTVAAGLATAGMLPFVSTFAVFASLRAAEQFRNSVCYPHLNVKVVGTHAGLECGADGATHQVLEDLAVMTSIAGNTVLVPATPIATRELIKLAADYVGPCYLRVGRDKVNELYSETTSFKIGGSHKLRDGKDVAILAIGSRVEASVKAAELLKEKGINASVYDMYSIKPIDKAAIKEAVATGHIVTVEDHSVYGGLGSIVCQEVCALNKPCPVSVIGVNSFGRSGSAKELFTLFNIDVEDIVNAVLKQLN